MSNQAVIISININNRSSAHIIMMSLAAGETLKAARWVYAAVVTDDVPMLCFNHQHWLHQQLNAEKCSNEGQDRLFAALYLTSPRWRSASRIHFKSRGKECQQWRLSKRGLSCPNIRSPDFLLYISSLEPGAALSLAPGLDRVGLQPCDEMLTTQVKAARC